VFPVHPLFHRVDPFSFSLGPAPFKAGLRKSRPRAWIRTLASASPCDSIITAISGMGDCIHLESLGDRSIAGHGQVSPIAWRDRRSTEIRTCLRIRALANAILSGPLRCGIIPIDWLPRSAVTVPTVNLGNLPVDGDRFYNPTGTVISRNPSQRVNGIWKK
jgi:hypothetical protein